MVAPLAPAVNRPEMWRAGRPVTAAAPQPGNLLFNRLHDASSLRRYGPRRPAREDGKSVTTTTTAIEFTVNGRPAAVSVDEETPLLDVLRNSLDLKGSRFGCGLEQCGCCMVLIDGALEKACAKPMWSVAGKAVTTVEGLGTPEAPHPLQQAFLDEQAGQCGYCLSGILVAAKALLDRNPSPTRREIAEALDQNICRCGAHQRMVRAVEKAAAAMRREAAR